MIGASLVKAPIAKSTNILADRLAMLCENGIVEKRQDPENGSRYIYRLTGKGKELVPVMFAIIDWAEKYDPNTEVPREFIRKLRRDPDRLRDEILSVLE